MHGGRSIYGGGFSKRIQKAKYIKVFEMNISSWKKKIQCPQTTLINEFKI